MSDTNGYCGDCHGVIYLVCRNCPRPNCRHKPKPPDTRPGAKLPPIELVTRADIEKARR